MSLKSFLQLLLYLLEDFKGKKNLRQHLFHMYNILVSSVSHVWHFATPWTAAPQASLSITNSQSLLKLLSVKLVMPSNHLILCCPLLLLPSIFPSIRFFSVLHIRWPKYWSFNFSISPSNEYSGPISFRMDWLDLLAVQGTLKNLLQQTEWLTLSISGQVRDIVERPLTLIWNS